MFLPLPAAVFIPVKPCFVIGLSATLICAFKATSKTDGKNVICLPIKQLGVLQNSFKCVICSRSNWKCFKRENQSSWRKTCRSKKVNPQQTQITDGVDARIWTRGHIARRCTTVTPLTQLWFPILLQHDGKNWTLDLQIRSSRCFIPLDYHDSFSKSTQYRQYSKYRFKIWFKWKFVNKWI